MAMFWQLEKHAENQALIDEQGCTFSYGDLAEACRQLEPYLPASGLVFILCRNTVAALVGYLACLRKGAVPLLLDADLDPQRLRSLAETYHPGLIWQPMAAGSAPVWQWRDYQLIATRLTPYPLHRDLALLMTTSGSTGSPKLVRLSRRNLQCNADSIKQYLALDATERPLVHLPLHYVYGLSIVNSHLLAGATLVMTTQSVMQREFWQGIERNQVTSLSGVPYTWEMLHRLRFSRMSLPSLRTLTQAGGKLSPALHQHFADYARQNDKQFVVMYGAAEATSRMAWLPAEQAVEKCGAIGQAIPGGQLFLKDDQGELIVQPAVQGELCYRGENVMMGYASSGDDLACGDQLHGELLTGDLAVFDEQGCFTVVGRKKRFLKIFGNRVGLDEMEMLLKNRFSGLACACIGRDDRLTIVLTDPDLQNEVLRYAAQSTRLHPSAFRFRIVPAIPLTATGKTHYERLNEDDAGI
ncbi:AMP-binding protein [Erwinia amylovora]